MSRQVDVARARSRKLDVDRAAAELRKIAPNAGSYVSESNYFNSSWREAYWGTNYPRLRAVREPRRLRTRKRVGGGGALR